MYLTMNVVLPQHSTGANGQLLQLGKNARLVPLSQQNVSAVITIGPWHLRGIC